jgi:hypothetical protein
MNYVYVFHFVGDEFSGRVSGQRFDILGHIFHRPAIPILPYKNNRGTSINYVACG